LPKHYADDKLRNSHQERLNLIYFSKRHPLFGDTLLGDWVTEPKAGEGLSEVEEGLVRQCSHGCPKAKQCGGATKWGSGEGVGGDGL